MLWFKLPIVRPIRAKLLEFQSTVQHVMVHELYYDSIKSFKLNITCRTTETAVVD
jgi:hypothetical protein